MDGAGDLNSLNGADDLSISSHDLRSLFFFCILRLRYHAGSQPAAKRESTQHQLIQVIFVNGSKLTIRGFPRVTSDRETDKEEPDRDRI